MSTTQEFIVYVCEQIHGEYNITYKKMFGEYMVYVNSKPILLVCDNCVYVKKLPQLEKFFNDSETAIPYKGAKEHYILDIDNNSLMEAVIPILENITPIPKKKVKK